MYYAEGIINNVLCYKNSPKGNWIEFTNIMLTNRVTELEKRLLEEFNQGDSKQ